MKDSMVEFIFFYFWPEGFFLAANLFQESKLFVEAEI